MSDTIFSTPAICPNILDGIHFKIKKNPTPTMEKINEFYQENKFVDINLIVGRNTFLIKAHRVVLSASSKYFFNTLTMRPDKDYLEIPEIDEVTMKVILKFIYTSSIDITMQAVKAITEGAFFLKMPDLIELCLNFIKKNVDLSNCLCFAKLAWDYDEPDVLKICLAVAHYHFNEIRNRSEFFQTSPELLREIVSSDFLCVDSEEVVLESIIDWADFDPKTRHGLLASLLGEVRYGMLDPLFITKVREAIQGIPNCDDIIFRWLAHHIENSQKGIMSKIRPRNVSHYYSMLCGESTDDWNIVKYDGIFDTWSREDLPKSPHKRTYFKAVKSADDRIYIAGGKMDGQPTERVESLDLNTNTWDTLPNMQYARLGHILALIKGELFAIGGMDDDQSEPFLSVERYNSKSRSWETVSLMSKPLDYSHRYAIINERIYITNVYQPNYLTCFETLSFGWTQHYFNSTVEKVIDMVAIDDVLYLCLKNSNENFVELFNPAENRWKKLDSKGIERFVNIRMFAFSQKLVFWGRAANCDRKTYLVEMYDPKTGEFRSLTPLKELFSEINNK